MDDYEIWKDIPHYEGIYKVSNYGRVHSVSRLMNNSRGGKSKKKGVLITPKTNTKETLFTLYKDGERKNINIHQLVSISF